MRMPSRELTDPGGGSGEDPSVGAEPGVAAEVGASFFGVMSTVENPSGHNVGQNCASNREDDSDSGDDTSESGSTCTILDQKLPLETSETAEGDEREIVGLGARRVNGEDDAKQILSIDNLPVIATVPSGVDSLRANEDYENLAEFQLEEYGSPLVEINLNEEAECTDRFTGELETRDTESRAESVPCDEMFSQSYRPDEGQNVTRLACDNQPERPTNLLNHIHQQHNFRCLQQQQHHHYQTPQQFKGFGEAQPKLSFASQRMKEYFETFRGRGSGKTVRLYQFFKSTRTELVACLLFSLITSQVLIVLRSNLQTERSACWHSIVTSTSTWRQSQGSHKADRSPQLAHEQRQDDGRGAGSGAGSLQGASLGLGSAADRAAGGAAQISPNPGLLNNNNNNNNNNKQAVIVHLANGLAMSFTVASLTQVFGHISGCHLIPSVSLALYIKGHISKARLASYLAAQFFGSGLGVALLSLLSSSQISPDEYRQLLHPAQLGRQEYGIARDWMGGNFTNNWPPGMQATGKDNNNNLRSRRKRRQTGPLVSPELDLGRLASGGGSAGGLSTVKANDGDDIDLREFQGSETILLSIMEQQKKLQHRNRPNDNRGTSPEEEKTITVNASSTYEEPLPSARQPQVLQELGPAAKVEPKLGPNLATSLQTQTTTTTTTTPKPPNTTSTVATTTTPAATTSSGPMSSSALDGGQVWTSFGASVAGQYPVSQSVGADGSGQLRASNIPQTTDNEPGHTNDRARVLFELAAGIPTTSSSLPDIVAIGGEPTLAPDKTIGVGSPESQQAAELQALLRAPINSGGLIGGGGSFADESDVVKPPKLRRRRRNRQQQQQLQQPQVQPQAQEANTSGLLYQDGYSGAITNGDSESKHYINLLEFALPDRIMSSESIRQCIEAQHKQTSDSQLASNDEGPKFTQMRSSLTNNEKLRQQQQLEEMSLQLATRSFGQCLSLSNSSQMFVFQFLATLLVVLAYLVNVDPRRIDLGFKSLSIGLAYFVGALLTVNSGGFMGNPFHLVFLNWFSTTSEWRSEWLIYLVTPFISGLFGSISHEYIDFSSLRNRNKQLHLRRSFYSLDNLPQQMVAATDSGAIVGGGGGSGCVVGGGGQRSDSHATVVEISSLTGTRRSRKVSSSSSPESTGIASSMMSLNGPEPIPSASMVATEQQQQQQQQQQLNHINLSHHQFSGNNHNHYSNIQHPDHGYGHHQQEPQQQQRLGSESFGTNRKLISYSRQLRLEQQRAAAVVVGQCQTNGEPKRAAQGSRTSLRRSDFDSNFLISSSCSSPPAASRRQLHTSGWM